MAESFCSVASRMTRWKDAISMVIRRIARALASTGQNKRPERENSNLAQSTERQKCVSAALAWFNEDSYLAANPDVAAAVASGSLASGKHHYIAYGYDECRRTADRRNEMLKHISKTMKGIEIGPYINPLAPKRDGFNCLSIDVRRADELRQSAAADPCLPQQLVANIEEVDIVGSATEIAALAAGALGNMKVDYVISSHNFEHLPNPIRFLNGCEEVLKGGGYLSMVLPDLRASFDFFRSPTMLSEWLQAYFAGRTRPTEVQSFVHNVMQCRALLNGGEVASFTLQTDRSTIRTLRNLRQNYDEWVRFNQSPNDFYSDAHCWAFTPASFTLLMSELRFLGLTRFECVETVGSSVDEFYVHLRLPEGDGPAMPEDEFYRSRDVLLQRTVEELAMRAAGGIVVQG